MRRRITVFVIISVLWCGFIFFLSSENSKESSERSGRIITTVCEIVVPDYENYTEAEKAKIVKDMSFSVRKAAHFTAYAILGALLFQVFFFVKDKRLRSLFSIGGAFLYAVSDEFHQSFSPGRSCEFRDMMIDTGGATLAVLISLLIFYIKDKKRQKSA